MRPVVAVPGLHRAAGRGRCGVYRVNGLFGIKISEMFQ